MYLLTPRLVLAIALFTFLMALLFSIGVISFPVALVLLAFFILSALLRKQNKGFIPTFCLTLALIISSPYLFITQEMPFTFAIVACDILSITAVLVSSYLAFQNYRAETPVPTSGIKPSNFIYYYLASKGAQYLFKTFIQTQAQLKFDVHNALKFMAVSGFLFSVPQIYKEAKRLLAQKKKQQLV